MTKPAAGGLKFFFPTTTKRSTNVVLDGPHGTSGSPFWETTVAEKPIHEPTTDPFSDGLARELMRRFRTIFCRSRGRNLI